MKARSKAIRLEHLAPYKKQTEPFDRLIMAVVLNAVRDLHRKGKNSFKLALDAAIFLVLDAPLIMEFLGFESDPVLWLVNGAQMGDVRRFEVLEGR